MSVGRNISVVTRERPVAHLWMLFIIIIIIIIIIVKSGSNTSWFFSLKIEY